jgi:hypothetical protein
MYPGAELNFRMLRFFFKYISYESEVSTLQGDASIEGNDTHKRRHHWPDGRQSRIFSRCVVHP